MSMLAGAGLAAAAGIGAAGGLLSSGMNGLINYGLQKDSQAFNAEEALKQREWSSNEALLNREFNAIEAQKARDFNEFMARNGVQMRVEDLKKAGINPALAGGISSSALGGPSASSGSSPGGFGATSSASHVNDSFSSIFSSAIRSFNGSAKDELEEKIGESFIRSASQKVKDDMLYASDVKFSRAEEYAIEKISELNKQGFNVDQIFEKLSNDKSIKLKKSALKDMLDWVV